jgi:hypothetical protein
MHNTITNIALPGAVIVGWFIHMWFVKNFHTTEWDTLLLLRDNNSKTEGWVDLNGQVVTSWRTDAPVDSDKPAFAGKLPDGYKMRIFKTTKTIFGEKFTQWHFDYNQINNDAGVK